VPTPTPSDTAVTWPDPVRLGGPAVDEPPPPAPSRPPDQAATPPRRSSQARAAIRPTRVAGTPPDSTAASTDAEARPDDPDLDEDGLQGADLLASRLGARVIEEIPHQP